MAEGAETFRVRLSDPQGARLGAEVAIGTIVDDDTRAVRVEPTALNVPEGGAADYTVVLGSHPTDVVTVAVGSGSPELTAEPSRLLFSTVTWNSLQTVTMTAVQDEDALADEPVEVTHTGTGGGYHGVGAVVVVTIVEDDVPTLAVAPARAAERDPRLRFRVTLTLAGEHDVTARYATGADGDSAVEGQDYTRSDGTIRFPARSTAAQTIEVSLRDDTLDEPDEHLTLTLSDPKHAALAGGGTELTVRGTIGDDDPLPLLGIEDSSLTEGTADDMRFSVTLDPASGRLVTVCFATADDTATAGADYTAVSGTLTFLAGATAGTVLVPILSDMETEEAETLTVTLCNPIGATLSDATATGTIADNPPPIPPPPEPDTPPRLTSLQVTGGGTMNPAFDPDVRHYGVRCGRGTTLQVRAQAKPNTAQLTLLRDNQDDNVVATGSLATSVAVLGNHDVVIDVVAGDETARYIVHCVPLGYPAVTILEKTATPTEGLLFLTVGALEFAVVDYNGVTRHRVTSKGRSFRPHANGPVIDGKQVRYSILEGGAKLMAADFTEIRTARALGSLSTDHHDFVLGTDSFFFISYADATRDYTVWGDDLPSSASVQDSVISEVAFAGADTGTERRRWNSWDHLKIVPDCEVDGLQGEYAHLNSLQLVDGDIIASFRGCAQVVRIDRSSGDWALEWKLGGTAPPRISATEHLEIVDDPLGEFCGQHHATLFEKGGKEHVLLFDNGVHCLGARKNQAPITRVVEYDISSGTQASFVREYRRPAGHGYSWSEGGVTLLDNGHWLIGWGTTAAHTVPTAQVATVSEVDTAGNAVFHMNISKSGRLRQVYRAYHDDEANVTIPLNLP